MKNFAPILFSALILAGCNSTSDSEGLNPYDETSESAVEESAEPSDAPHSNGPSADDIQSLKTLQE